MAAGFTRWRTACRLGAVLFAILIQVVNGYEQMYSVSQLSPKSLSLDRKPRDVILETSQTEPLVLSIESSALYDRTSENGNANDEKEAKHNIVERSAAHDGRESRSINLDEYSASNNNEIDNEVEIHNKRKYYDIQPTTTVNFYDDDEEIVMSSSGFGDKFNFKFPGEANRVPRARALNPMGPKIRPTAVQPTMYATATYRDEGRQNTEIQNIITGLVKLLNGNVNVQANTQLLNGRPGRPMASRINNRGPPRISDVPSLLDFDNPVTHNFVPTKTPPPYPFDMPMQSHHGVNLPEQIVPALTPPRPPGFHRPPVPPWTRPRPRPPNRRPGPGLPIYKPTLPPLPIDIPNLDEEDFKRPEDDTATENESSLSENNIHHESDSKVTEEQTTTAETTKEDVSTLSNLEPNTTENTDKNQQITVSNTTDSSTTSTTTTSTTTSNTTSKTIELSKKTTPKPISTSSTERVTTTEKSKPEKLKVEKDKKKGANSDKDKPYKIINKVSEEKINQTDVRNIIDDIESSITEVVTSTEVPIATPTPTKGLISDTNTLKEATTTEAVAGASVINSLPLPSIPPSTNVPHEPYRPRPGIVLDDTDFKPHGTRFRPDAPVITAAETRLPGYGEIFDVTVSAIQGAGEGDGSGSVHIENVSLSGLSEHDDIIVSATGDQGFVSIDGKRQYLNLFDTSSVAGVTTIKPTQVQSLPHHSGPSLSAPPIGTGIAIPADDIPQMPIRRPKPSSSSTAHGHSRPQLPFRRPQPTVRIDTCIVGDDSTCDQAQNEKCRTESGISSCQCRPGYARRVHRDPCRRAVALLLSVRVDRLYDRKVAWDSKLGDKDSEPYQQLSYEAVRAIDSAFSMTAYSDDFLSGSVNAIHQGDEHNQGVFVNFTVMIQESPELLRTSVATDIQKHLLGVIRRRSNNIGASALWVETPAGSVLPVKDLDECASSEFNDCHQLAHCTNTWGGFMCQCPESTRDQLAGSSTRAGRHCEACANSHCNERGTCHYANNQAYCSCSSGYYGSTCEVDGEVVGVAVGASLGAALVIALTLAALLSWSRKWSREQKAAGMGSPVFNYMAANTVKTPPVGKPPYQVTLEERMRWAQIAEAMAQSNHYAPEPAQAMATRPSSAMFVGYPTLPPVPMPRMGVHGGLHTGTMNTVTSRANMSGSHHNLYAYTNHMATESTSSDASSHVQDRADLLVPRPKSRARSMQNQTGIYYDVDYENAPEPIYGSKGIPLSTYTVGRGPPFYRT